MHPLSDAEMLRYNRQIMLRHFDFEGQEALKNGKVLLLGAGGLGCAASQYLVVAGVGHITLIDDDKVELSNLARQVLHHDSDIGQLKVISAQQSLSELNPHSHIEIISERLDDNKLSSLIAQHDVVIDASDNVTTRNQLNRLCFAHKRPLVSGAAIRMEGQICVFHYHEDEPCYQCLSALFGDSTLTCVEAGVMAPVVGIIGAMQALEAIKLLAHYGETPQGKVLIFDALTLSWRQMTLPKQANCPICQ
ncbi:molybdopterin-synthase adenylyltransferase MoeB [Vibrio sp. SM6]|uniref:Molybdopterin-synthase adenylyltransferase n=1 Tax=Vibrio agarilyticus TaxID=2726741 RepID=A0A7X8TRU9_9VIBR|nr:molybdopterin-synthase adenylyltransferase MoeB [Vibrio agarilyticus]